MIYNESTKSFIKLETALKELGFDQQTICLLYTSPSPRDCS